MRATGGEVGAASSLAPKIGPLGLSPKKVRAGGGGRQAVLPCAESAVVKSACHRCSSADAKELWQLRPLPANRCTRRGAAAARRAGGGPIIVYSRS